MNEHGIDDETGSGMVTGPPACCRLASGQRAVEYREPQRREGGSTTGTVFSTGRFC